MAGFFSISVHREGIIYLPKSEPINREVVDGKKRGQ